MDARVLSSSPRAEPGLAALVGAAAVAVFLGAWALLGYGFYARDRIVDTPVYERYGDAIADGEVPYRDFRPEYPPAALPVFAVPSLVGADYETAFAWLMAASGAAAVALAAVALVGLGSGRARLVAALGFVALWPLALGSVVPTRFDLWPAALTMGALAALLAGRLRLGGGLLGLAAAAKLYPAALAPLAAVWVWRRHGQRAALASSAAFAGVLAAALLPFAVLAPDGLGASLGRQLSRPLQIESLGGAVLVALHHVAGLGVEMVGSHGSQNIAGGLGVAVGAASTAVQLAALALVWTAFVRGPATPERLVRYAALALAAFVALGKVLSPQFLIWLAPLVPLVAGRRGLVASAVLAAALVLTQTWFPFRYWDYAREFDGAVTGLVLARDVVLLGLVAVLAWPGRQAS